MVESTIKIMEGIIEWSSALPPYLSRPVPIHYAWAISGITFGSSVILKGKIRSLINNTDERIKRSNPQNTGLWLCRLAYVGLKDIPIIRLTRRVVLYHPLVNCLPIPSALLVMLTSIQWFGAKFMAHPRPEYFYLWPDHILISFNRIKGISYASVLCFSLYLEAIGEE